MTRAAGMGHNRRSWVTLLIAALALHMPRCSGRKSLLYLPGVTRGPKAASEGMKEVGELLRRDLGWVSAPMQTFLSLSNLPPYVELFLLCLVEPLSSFSMYVYLVISTVPSLVATPNTGPREEGVKGEEDCPPDERLTKTDIWHRISFSGEIKARLTFVLV
jgi:hypothetical protein